MNFLPWSSVCQLVVAMSLVQAVCSVLYLQASVLAKLDTPEELVIPVPPTTSEQVVELAKPVVAIPMVQAVCSVLILQASVLAKLLIKGPNVIHHPASWL